MISLHEAQELHLLIGVAIELGDYGGRLDRAREIAALIVSDAIDRDAAHAGVSDDVYFLLLALGVESLSELRDLVRKGRMLEQLARDSVKGLSLGVPVPDDLTVRLP